MICATIVSLPALTARFSGAGDAHYYLYQLVDFLTQFRNGIIPVYVGQTNFEFSGDPYALFAYFFYLAAAIDFLTLHVLSFVVIQHLTLFASFLMGGFSMYAALRSLAPARSWEAAVIACLYIFCPGVASLPYVFDMYLASMTIPLVVLVFTSMIHSMRNPAGPLSYTLTAISLSLLWMAHPPIALWTTTVALIGQACALIFCTNRSRILRNYFVSYLIFLILTRWYFVSVFQTGIGGKTTGRASAANQVVTFVDPAYVKAVVDILKSVIPGVFLPLSFDRGALTILQLGYSLWILFAFSAIAGFRFRSPPELKAVLTCILFLLVMLVPVPYISVYAIAHLPAVFTITQPWFMERLYVPLAALTCIAGILALDTRDKSGRWSRFAFPAAAALLLAWSGAEVSTIVKFGKGQRGPEELAARLLAPENVILFSFSGLSGGRAYEQTVHDPALENRLLTGDMTPLAVNLERVLTKGKANPAFSTSSFVKPRGSPTVAPIHITGPDASAELFKLAMEPGKRYLLAFRLRNNGYNGLMIQLQGPGFYREYFPPATSTDIDFHAIPIWTSGPQSTSVTTRLAGRCPHAGCSADFAAESFTPYSAVELPIKLRSLAPYAADVTTDHEMYLETHRMYLPGYEATVNDRPTDVLRSPDGNAMVPIPAGHSEIQLIYLGTGPMRVSWWISLLGWIATLSYLLIVSLRRGMAGQKH